MAKGSGSRNEQEIQRQIRRQAQKAGRKFAKKYPLLALALIVLAAAGCFFLSQRPGGSLQAPEGALLQVHFIDVGQADCILAVSGGEYMIVDAGNNEDAGSIVSYLEQLGVTRLKYAIGTHPHEDHIGSLDAVINAFPVDTVILPNVTTETKTFEDVLDAVEARDLEITLPEPGDEYMLGQASFRIIAPVKEYDEDALNNWSVGIRLSLGSTDFVMTGDAEYEAEKDIVEHNLGLSAEVLKLGHHGSSTSSCEEFLNAVSPDYAVITCGVDNSYGHPHDEVIEAMREHGIDYFRTDTQGTVIAYSDGSSLSWNQEPAK